MPEPNGHVMGEHEKQRKEWGTGRVVARKLLTGGKWNFFLFFFLVLFKETVGQLSFWSDKARKP